MRLATAWVEPAYLEPDASWCAPGDEPASPLANGGAFGGKLASLAPAAASALASALGRTVRVVYSREDVVRLGPKRPPIAATAVWRDGAVEIDGRAVRIAPSRGLPAAYSFATNARWESADVPGPPVAAGVRAYGLAEQAVLVEGALDAAGIDRRVLTDDDALLDTLVLSPSGARAGARVAFDDATGRLAGVEVRLAAGDPLDEVVLRSYALGAAHMALGWVLTESIAVDRIDGRSARPHDPVVRHHPRGDMPPVTITILPDPAPARERSSDAVFAAVAAATWNALARVEGARPDTFPARDTRASRLLRR